MALDNNVVELEEAGIGDDELRDDELSIGDFASKITAALLHGSPTHNIQVPQTVIEASVDQ